MQPRPRVARLRLATLAVAVLFVVSGLVGLVPAGAASTKPSPTPSPSPDLSQYKVTSFRVEDSGTTDVGILAACRNRSFSVIGTSPLGDAWKFTASAYWCYSTGANPHITSVTWGQAGVTYQPGYSYEGVAGDIRGGCVGTGCSYVYRRVTGDFSFCLPICYFHDYPYISITARADGSSTVGWGMAG